MTEFLKGNFKVKKDVAAPSTKEAGNEQGAEQVSKELRKAALASIGGSMVYIERETLSWDGEDDQR